MKTLEKYNYIVLGTLYIVGCMWIGAEVFAYFNKVKPIPVVTKSVKIDTAFEELKLSAQRENLSMVNEPLLPLYGIAIKVNHSVSL
jgi:hypothetical protein